MTRLTARLAKLEAAVAVSRGCRDPFHHQWHILKEDEETGVIPEPPACPTCGAKPDRVIVVEYAKDWRAAGLD